MKIGIYVQATYGIGHAVMMARLANVLPGKVFLFYGGPKILLPIKDHVTLVCLPGLVDNEQRNALVSLSKDDCNEIWSKRKQILQQYVGQCDVLILEHYPFGRELFQDEVNFLLMLCKQHGTSIFCSVRDILGKTYSLENQRSIRSFLQHKCTQVFVHGDPQIYNVIAHHPSLFKNINAVFTGYLCPFFHKSEERYGYVVHAGGGREAHPHYSTMKFLIEKHPGEHFYVYSGIFGDTDLPDLSHYDNVTMKSWDVHLWKSLPQRKGVFGFTGYNTTIECVSSQTPAHLSVWPNSHEQQLRQICFAQFLSDNKYKTLPDRPSSQSVECNGLQWMKAFFKNQL